MAGRHTVHKRDIGAQLLVGFNGVSLNQELKSILDDFKVGGIVLFKKNIESPEQLQVLLDEAQNYAREILKRPLWVAIDQEGGPVQRLVPPCTQLPAARELAYQGSGAVGEWARIAALELRRLGIQINLAPVLDVVPEGASHFMEARSLGSDPEVVAQLGAIWIRALQENGVSATAKHYPGLGQAELDPHHFAPLIRWHSQPGMEKDLLPFKEAIRTGVHCMMTSHALYPSLDPDWPATLSPVVNNEWLRRRLRFEGVLLSDDMDMAAVSENYTWEQMACQGLRASIDFFLLCQRSENIEPFFRSLSDGIQNDATLAGMHRKSLSRIEKLCAHHA